MNTVGSKRGNFPEPVAHENEQVKEYQYLARYLANFYWYKNYKNTVNRQFGYDMAWSAAMMGLLRGIRTYNPEKNDNKGRYLAMCIACQISNDIYKYGNFIHSKKSDGFAPCDITEDILTYDFQEDEPSENYEALEFLNTELSEEQVDVLTMDEWHWRRKYKGVNRDLLKYQMMDELKARMKNEGLL